MLPASLPFCRRPGLALFSALLPALLLLIACNSDEEAPATTTPAPTSSIAPSGTPSPTIEQASPTPNPTPVLTVPADWKTYTDASGLFTIRYPVSWFQTPGQAQFSSYDLSTLTTSKRPPETLTVEVEEREASGSDSCGGTISPDPKSGEQLGPLPGATATTLGDVEAWEMIRTKGDPAISEEDLSRIHRIAVIRGGLCAFITAYYTQQNPDVQTFLQITRSFKFTP